MVRRAQGVRFMPGAWVFPGGMVDDADRVAGSLIRNAPQPAVLAYLAAALRELVEETGIWLTDTPFVEPVRREVFRVAADRDLQFDASQTAQIANWITPRGIPLRFDAHFFVAAVDRLQPIPDGLEVDDARFLRSTEALQRAADGEWSIPFPTQRTLERLAGFSSVGGAIAEWRSRKVVPVEPRLLVAADGSLQVMMPGEKGFDEIGPEDVAAVEAFIASTGGVLDGTG